MKFFKELIKNNALLLLNIMSGLSFGGFGLLFSCMIGTSVSTMQNVPFRMRTRTHGIFAAMQSSSAREHDRTHSFSALTKIIGFYGIYRDFKNKIGHKKQIIRKIIVPGNIHALGAFRYND